jgi:cytochrome c
MILSPDAGPPPSAEVIADPSFGNAPLTVNFRGRLLTDANGTSTSFVWDFGDLQTGNQLNVSHTYKMPGTYTATLTAAAESGGKDSKSITVYVLPPGVRLPADIVPH